MRDSPVRLKEMVIRTCLRDRRVYWNEARHGTGMPSPEARHAKRMQAPIRVETFKRVKLPEPEHSSTGAIIARNLGFRTSYLTRTHIHTYTYEILQVQDALH